MISNAGSCKVYRHRSPVQIWINFWDLLFNVYLIFQKTFLKELIYFMLSRYPKRVLKLKSSLNASERWSSALKQDLKILEQIVIINWYLLDIAQWDTDDVTILRILYIGEKKNIANCVLYVISFREGWTTVWWSRPVDTLQEINSIKTDIINGYMINVVNLLWALLQNKKDKIVRTHGSI